MKTTERAKEIRKELKVKFPGVKFSVRSKSYSGGSSISVNWTDFPTREAVEEITNKFESVRYDEYTGEILSGGNTYIHTYNTWSEDMESNIKSNLINQYGEEFYNEHIQGYDYYRYARKAFENLYLQSITVEEIETIESTAVITEGTTVTLNDELNGIEISFASVPTEEVRSALKSNGFRYSRAKKIWYAKQSDDRIFFANTLVTPAIDPEILTNEEIEYLETIAAEYTNQILKEELEEIEKEIKPIEFKEVDTSVFLNDISIGRKENNIHDVFDYAEKENIIINKYAILSDNDFDFLSTNLLNDYTFINGLGGTRVTHAGTKQEIDYNNFTTNDLYYKKELFDFYEDNILITNESNTMFIVINPHGHSYCRYTGILTAGEGNKVLKQLKGEAEENNEILAAIEEKKNIFLTNDKIIVNDRPYKKIVAYYDYLHLLKNNNAENVYNILQSYQNTQVDIFEMIEYINSLNLEYTIEKENNLHVLENDQNQPESETNVQVIETIYNDIEALENRLKLVNSAKLKYKIQSEIESKTAAIAQIILNDPILYAEFMKEN